MRGESLLKWQSRVTSIVEEEEGESVLVVRQQEGPTTNKTVVNTRVRSGCVVSVGKRDDV